MLASLEWKIGDLCDQTADALLVPTDRELSGSGGPDRSVHLRAGREFEAACRAAVPCPEGTAVVLPGGALKARAVVCTAVPRRTAGQPPREGEYLLAACYENALRAAARAGCRSIALPAMGAGAGGFPAEQAARVAAEAILVWGMEQEELFHLCLVFSSEEKLELYRKALLRQLVRQARLFFSPAALAHSFGHRLPLFLEEAGGMVTLPPEKARELQNFRDAWNRLNQRYGRVAEMLYRLAGRPDLSKTMGSSLSLPPRADAAEQMTLPACACYLEAQHRADYASGGVDGASIRACIDGSVDRVLARMERLLEP